MLARHELWRKEYREDRYLEHLDEENIFERCSHLMASLITLESNGKIGMLRHTELNAQSIMIKFTHVLEELGLRGKGLRKGLLDSVAAPEPSLEFAKKFTEMKSKFGGNKGYLFKFGQSEFLSKYSFKIALASSYGKYDNISQKDSELKATLTPPPKDFTITTANGEKIKDISGVKLQFETSWDYYIFCTSFKLDFRLFNDFEADSCLVIKDRGKFSKVLGEAMNELVPLEEMKYGLVEYFDPVKHNRKGEPEIQFHKHLKYFYQSEHRHVFSPRTQSNLKEEIFLELPELKDICELVKI